MEVEDATIRVSPFIPPKCQTQGGFIHCDGQQTWMEGLLSAAAAREAQDTRHDHS